MVVVPLRDGEAALDVTECRLPLAPGELALYSQGGASVVLKNNGDVVINGKVFSA
jgi:phage gp45-like